MKSTNLSITICLFFLASSLSQHAQQMEQEHGEITFETSCNSEAQAHFEHGLGMIHHMMYDQALDIFNKAVEADQDCAMAYWGIAMTQLNPLWAPPGEEAISKGWDTIKKADQINGITEKEQSYINALYTYYETTNEKGYREGLRAWEESLEEVHKQFPDDIDAGAFYGLSLLATASPDDESFSQQREAGALLEELYEKAPQHPGLYHYIIHAYDNPVLSQKGVEFAHGYDQLAPNVPHALHMPSHIFVRIGNWDETIDWNRRSADAALDQPVGDNTSMHHAHALDYMMYGYLQKGQSEKAKAVLDELLSVQDYQPHFGAAYGIAAAHARYLLERRDWQAAAEINPNELDYFPWENFPQYRAITWWAKGMGAARTGDLESARNAVEKIDQLYEQTRDMGEDYWALLVDVQRKTVQAWISHEEGNYDEALSLMREAADLEDSVDKNPVTPSEVLPARELLGDMLMIHDKPEEALTAYNKTLEFSPNRFNSLFGAGKAAKTAGDRSKAVEYFSKLAQFAEMEESDRPELEEVAAVLKEE